MSGVIGFSLPLGYLAADPGADLDGSDALLWQTFGMADKCLTWLIGRGVQSIEIRGANYGADAYQVLRAAGRIWAAGMALTLHASLPPDERGGTLAETYPYLTALSHALPARQYSITVTVHAYTSHDQSPAQNARRTAWALASIAAACRREGLAVQWALEINRARGLPDPATIFEGVTEILQAAGAPEIGICWDFGHTLANLRNGVLTLPAPETFLRQVTHTHIHGIGANGKTHCAVSAQSAPLRQFIQPLRLAGYKGVYNLELSPDRMTNEEGLEGQFASSISVLQEALGDLPE